MKIKEKHKLRKPTGPYTVGAVSFFFEYGPGEGNPSKRIIPGLCYYPAKNRGAGLLKKYANETIVPDTGGIETNTYLDAPIADGQHPLIIYNHGFSLGLESNTIQFEELASHGYLVLSLGHLGDGSYELPGGELSMFEAAKMMQEYQEEGAAGAEWFTRYGKWLAEEGRDAPMPEQRDYYQKLINIQPKLVAHSEVWIKESLLALEMFLKNAGEAGSKFYNHVDKEKIGALGMSYGGSVALSLAQESALVKAAADLDGFFYSPLWEQPINKPFIVIQHDGLGGLFLTYPFLIAGKDAYLVTANHSTHANFADYNEIIGEDPVMKVVFLGEEIEYTMLGKIDPAKWESLLNNLLLDFFDKYLKGHPSQVIDSHKLPEEVALRRK